MGHKGRIHIKRFSTVMGQQLQVATHMDDEEKDKEDASQAHDELLTEGGSEKSS